MHRILKIGGDFTYRAAGKVISLVSNDSLITEVEDGLADFSMPGSDKYGESYTDCTFEAVAPLDCQFVLAAPRGAQIGGWLKTRVASSYPQAFEKFVANNGLAARLVVEPKGKVEGYVDRGLADAVFDIRQTGTTLQKNGLEVVLRGETIKLGGLWRDTDRPIRPRLRIGPYLGSLATIADRNLQMTLGKLPETYSEGLLADENELVKKIASETGELIREICRPDFDRERFIGEAADSTFSMTIACERAGISFVEVLNELGRRNKPRL